MILIDPYGKEAISRKSIDRNGCRIALNPTITGEWSWYIKDHKAVGGTVTVIDVQQKLRDIGLLG